MKGYRRYEVMIGMFVYMYVHGAGIICKTTLTIQSSSLLTRTVTKVDLGYKSKKEYFYSQILRNISVLPSSCPVTYTSGRYKSYAKLCIFNIRYSCVFRYIDYFSHGLQCYQGRPAGMNTILLIMMVEWYNLTCVAAAERMIILLWCYLPYWQCRMIFSR